MIIERFYDEALAHASYIVISGDQAAVIDPARDPKPYYSFARKKGARIVAIFETHPHADFVSSHLEMARETGGAIYVGELVGADYPHRTFDEGDVVKINDICLRALHTPGHSPDSISIVAVDRKGKDRAVFTGDSLFIGDVGRPDLREAAGKITAKREELARQMYRTVHEKFMKLDDDVRVMPAHGAGSLCGKNMSDELESTIGEQKRDNAALQPMSEEAFVDMLLEGQPFVPLYFPYDVEVNKKGAPELQTSLKRVPRPEPGTRPPAKATVIDARPEDEFKRGHLERAINIPPEEKFETWLGALVTPGKEWYLIAGDPEMRETLLWRAAKIGYERFIQGATIYTEALKERESESLPLSDFKNNTGQYAILDVRNRSEVQDGKIFDQAINIPLAELSDRTEELPLDRPIVVHCASGYRSAIAFSILEKELGDKAKVYDLSEAITYFSEAPAAAG